MNPSDVAQAPLALPAADVSLWALFIQAHFVVKTVMIGLMIASVWVWAIVVDKTILYTRTRRADRPLRAGVLVGTKSRGALSIALLAPDPFDRGAFRGGDARVEANL